jgi:hypothetical protein
MRKLAALIVLIACGATATSISAGGSGKANLRLVDRDPLSVQGHGFKPRERVRVTASEPEWQRKTIRATATGSFRVAFSEIAVDRCSLVRVATIGAQGSRAVLKVLPSPMCSPSELP